MDCVEWHGHTGYNLYEHGVEASCAPTLKCLADWDSTVSARDAAWQGTLLQHAIPQRHSIPTASWHPTAARTPHRGLVSHGGMVSLRLGSIVADTYEAELLNEAARCSGRGEERAMRAHGCPMFLLQLQHRPNADANRKHRDDDPVNGAEGERRSARLRRKQAGLPSASTASATWLARTGECDAALRFPLRLGHQVAEHVNERWRGFVGAGSRELRAVR